MRSTGASSGPVRPSTSASAARSASSRCWAMCATSRSSAASSTGGVSATTTSTRPVTKHAIRQPGTGEPRRAQRARARQVGRGVAEGDERKRDLLERAYRGDGKAQHGATVSSVPVMAAPVSTTVTELPESRVRVEAEVPAAEVEKRVAVAARALGRNLRIPGFRSGKVPPPVSSSASGARPCSTRPSASRSPAGTRPPIDDANVVAGRRARSQPRRPARPRASRCASRSRSASARPPRSASTPGSRSAAASPRSTDEAIDARDRAAARPHGQARDRRARRRRRATSW